MEGFSMSKKRNILIAVVAAVIVAIIVKVFFSTKKTDKDIPDETLFV
jgi:uncharacterized membrane protein YvbJ